jgi:hypothetical protein
VRKLKGIVNQDSRSRSDATGEEEIEANAVG